MPTTLQQRIQQAVERKQFWFDPSDSPDLHIHCAFCEDALLIDYFQFGKAEMDMRLIAWANRHALCVPQLVKKTSDMTLTPKERAS